MIPRDITRQYRDIRVTGNIKERTPSRKRTPNRKRIPSRKNFMDSYSKLKIRIIKN